MNLYDDNKMNLYDDIICYIYKEFLNIKSYYLLKSVSKKFLNLSIHNIEHIFDRFINENESMINCILYTQHQNTKSYWNNESTLIKSLPSNFIYSSQFLQYFGKEMCLCNITNLIEHANDDNSINNIVKYCDIDLLKTKNEIIHAIKTGNDKICKNLFKCITINNNCDDIILNDCDLVQALLEYEKYDVIKYTRDRIIFSKKIGMLVHILLRNYSKIFGYYDPVKLSLCNVTFYVILGIMSYIISIFISEMIKFILTL